MWDARYGTSSYLYGTSPSPFLQSQSTLLAALPANSTALVLADGEGRNGVYLASLGLHVTSLDISPVGAAKTRALATHRGVSLHVTVSDILTHAWRPADFDVVVAVFIQFLTPDARRQVFDEISATLRPGGRVFLHGYRTEQIGYATGGPGEVEHLYDEETLAQAFPGYEIERLQSYDKEIEEGTGHVGMSALIDLVAKKPAAEG